jgi:DNA-3-methyladenine glycosylase I
MSDGRIRCPWGDTEDTLMREYHDKQWGKPCHDEKALFEMLTLEGAQAGLSWSTILHKREGYRAAFDNWDIEKIASYGEEKIAELLENPGIVRNKLKVRSVVSNAQATLKIGSLDSFFWNYASNTPIKNEWALMSDVPATTELSDKISRDMKKLGFKFVGSTIIYSFLQAVGIVNDHILGCEFRD